MSSRHSLSLLVQFIIITWVELASLEALEVLMVVDLHGAPKAEVAAEHPTFAQIPRWVPE
jgi:hypothetical protein